MHCPACDHVNRDSAKFCEECATALTGGDVTQLAAVAALPADFVDGRYRVDGLLGEGRRKTVYRAHDMRLDRDVAFSLIETVGLDAAGRAAVQQEAQAMARLSHPNIVTVFDFGEEAGRSYIVSEYLRGGDLRCSIRDAPHRKLPIDRVIEIAVQVTDALRYAHRAGVIHRDVKPSNVWLAADGTARLGDFGLAITTEQTLVTREGTVVGTVSYMPPEQATGRGDVRSDLYAFGCVLYELIAGRPPFVGERALTIVTQHLNTAPVAPAWHNDQCPPDLEALTLDLLEKDPNERPQSAEEVWMRLTALKVGSPAPGGGDAQLFVSPSPAYRRSFVGREQELNRIRGIFDAALSGAGGLVMVIGEPGIGKTAVAEQIATYVTLRSGRTLIGHCYEEGSASVPYLPFVQAMRSYALGCDDDALRRELGYGADDVARIVPELGDRLALEPNPPTTAEEDRYRLLEAVATFLRNVAASQPLCLVLEDLHNADHGTLELLRHLAINLRGARILLLGTYRDVEVDRTHPLSATLAELRRNAGFERVHLRGLGVDDVQGMLAGVARRDVQQRLAEAIHRQTEGNPLFVQEVFRHIAEEGLLEWTAGQWSTTNVDALIAQIPEGLRDVIGKRLTRLATTTNQVLAVAAVIGRDFDVDILRTVSRASESDLLAALSEAQQAAVLEERPQVGGSRYRFTHAFFRQTLYEELLAPLRIRLHREIGRALEEQQAHHLDEQAAALAEHFSHSSDAADLVKAVAYGEHAAQRAVAVYAYGEAVRLLEHAIQVQELHDPDGSARLCDLYLSLCEALLAEGKPRRVYEDVAEQAFQLAAGLEDSARLAQACVLALEGCWSASASGAFRTPFGRVWVTRADQHALPESSARILADLYMGTLHFMEGRPERALGLYEEAIATARRVGDPTLFQLAATRALSGLQGPRREDWTRSLADELANAPRDGVRAGVLAAALEHLAQIALTWGERQRAEDFWGEINDLADRTQHSEAIAHAHAGEAMVALLDGRLEEAVTIAQQAAAGETGRAPLSFVMVPALLWLGRYEDAYQNRNATYPWQTVRCLLALGRTAEAVEAMEAFLAVDRKRMTDSDWQWGSWLISSVLEAALHLQRRDLVSDLFDLLEPAHTATGGLFHVSCVDRLRGEATAFLGDPKRARDYYAAAIDVTTAIRFRPERAVTGFRLAELLLDHYPDESAEALHQLNFAIDEFRAMKMAPLLESAMALKLQQEALSDVDVHTSIDAVMASVDSERPDLTPYVGPDGTITLLVSDVVEASGQRRRVGEAAWAIAVQNQHGVMRDHLAEHNGTEVCLVDDGRLVAFRSASHALRFAVAVQRSLAERNSAGDDPIEVRVGIHTVEVLEGADDLVERHVAVVAAIAKAASGSEILISSIVHDLVDGTREFQLDRQAAIELDGVGGLQRIGRVLWRPDDAPAAHPDNLTNREVEVLRLIAAGETNRAIAKTLAISPDTVKRHVSNVLNKTGLSNRLQLARYAVEQGLLP